MKWKKLTKGMAIRYSSDASTTVQSQQASEPQSEASCSDSSSRERGRGGITHEMYVTSSREESSQMLVFGILRWEPPDFAKASPIKG